MTDSSWIDTDAFSKRLRARAVDVPNRRILVTNYRGTEQEKDLTVPPNCRGFGRIRHFKRKTSSGWPENPLPIDPARKALGLMLDESIQAQVFQNAACNWRCWYCYVPYELLSAREDRAAWLTAAELVDLYLAETNRPPMIDLSGGQPDLVPEWLPWTMAALRERGMDNSVYLWSDDNLSNDYYTRFLSREDREIVVTYAKYGRVGCFKGFDADSFAFNTRATPDLFERQFSVFRTLLNEGLDLYAYVTFTTPSRTSIPDRIARFMDSLQSLSPGLPLRTVPLEVQVFSPVRQRVGAAESEAMRNQWSACEAWQRELEQRFSSPMRSRPVHEIPLNAAA